MSAPTVSKKISKLHEFVASTTEVRCLALGPKQSRVMVTGGTDCKISVWIIGRPNLLMSFGGHTTSVECVRFRADEQVVASGSASGTLKVCDLDQGACFRTLSGHKAGVTSLDFHTSEMLLASGSMDTRVRVWDVRKKGCIYSYKGHTGKVNALLFSPDGKWLSSAGDDGCIKIWELSSGRLIQDFALHTGPVTSLQYHPNELLLASGSLDRTAKFWDLEQFGLVDESQPEATGVRQVTFHPDGTCLFSGSQECLRIHGWEPWQCYETVPAGWGKLADMRIVSDQLIAASYSHSSVSVWTSDVSNLRPFRKDDESVATKQDGLSASHRKIFERYNANISPTENIATEQSQSDSDHEETNLHIPSPMENEPSSEDFNKVFRVNNNKRQSSQDVLKKQKIQQQQQQQDYSNKPRLLKATENSEEEAIKKILEKHNTTFHALKSRQTTHREIRKFWDAQDPIVSLRHAINSGLQDALVDLMTVYNQRLSLWTLNMSLLILPEIKYIVQSLNLFYIQTAANTLKIILKSFGPGIALNIAQPPTTGTGVDISREERYQKCQDSYAHLSVIREYIITHQPDGKSPEKDRVFEELKRAYSALD